MTRARVASYYVLPGLIMPSGGVVPSMSSLEKLRTSVTYLRELRRFLRTPIASEECPRIVAGRLHRREQNFLTTLDTAVFGQPANPYFKLLNHAGINLADVVRLTQEGGVEYALRQLADAGVWFTYEEFKGRGAVRRGSLEFQVRPDDFDNRTSPAQYWIETAGSRDPRRRAVSLDILAHDATYHALFLEAFKLADRPMGLWRPVPPGLAGLHIVLRHAKLGKKAERWFSHNIVNWTQLNFVLAIYGNRLLGASLPLPEHVPLGQSARVAEWLATKRRQGMPALLDTNASSAVRVCQAALEGRLDISGTFFSVGGEPFTPAKARIVAQTGSTAVAPYTMNEVERIALPCAMPVDLDDGHVAADKLAVIQREKRVGTDGPVVKTLLLTTLMPVTPKLMFNVETDDYAILEDRDCGCLLQRLGLRTHLRQIRSYDKLTSEGMTFLGSRVLTLVEEILPARFGGYPTDYQFVEEEEDGLPRISIVVSPRVGPVDAEQLVSAVLSFLGSGHKARSMAAERWREAETLRVVRREPHATVTAKILPLHILPKQP